MLCHHGNDLGDKGPQSATAQGRIKIRGWHYIYIYTYMNVIYMIILCIYLAMISNQKTPSLLVSRHAGSSVPIQHSYHHPDFTRTDQPKFHGDQKTWLCRSSWNHDVTAIPGYWLKPRVHDRSLCPYFNTKSWLNESRTLQSVESHHIHMEVS